MKQFLLFAGDNHDPKGGWDDFITDADSIDELKSLVSCSYDDAGKYDYVYFEINHPRWDCDSPSDQWLQIVDGNSKEVVFYDNTQNHKDKEYRFIGRKEPASTH